MKRKDLSLDLFANVPITEIVYKKNKSLKILTHGNGFHYITKNTRLFICESDDFTDVFNPAQSKYVKKLISPYRIAYDFGLIEIKLYDFTKETYRTEAMTIIQKAINDGKGVVEIPNFFEREWREKRRLKNDWS